MDATLAWCRCFGRLSFDLITRPLLQSPRDRWALVVRILQIVVPAAAGHDRLKAERQTLF